MLQHISKLVKISPPPTYAKHAQKGGYKRMEGMSRYVTTKTFSQNDEATLL